MEYLGSHGARQRGEDRGDTDRRFGNLLVDRIDGHLTDEEQETHRLCQS